MSNFFKNKILLVALIIGIALAGYLLVNQKKNDISQNTTTVKRGDVVQEVSVTGHIEPVTTVNLGFEKSGRIQGVYAHIGDHVGQGTLLAEIESGTEQANVMEATARLAELKRGSRPEEIAVKEAELAKDTQDLNNAYHGTLDTVSDAFTKADDALHAKMTGVLSGFKTSSYRFTYQICDSTLETNAVWLRYTSETDLDLWRTEISNLPATPTNTELSQDLDRAREHLEKIRSFLEAVNRTLTLDCTIANTTLDTYRTNVNTARTNTTAAIAAINTKTQDIASLTLTVTKVQDELTLLKAGTANEVIAAQEARLFAAEEELRKSRLSAPIGGTVTRVDAKTGEFAAGAVPLISIISDTSFKITANIPESDIAKVKIGNMANITLDAYGSDASFEAKVTDIDPAETVIDNVPTYKVTLYFTKNDPRIKSGMTANIDIATARAHGVLFVSQRAVITKDNKKFITVVNADKTTAEIPITTGLRGSDGSIEVVSGASEGMIITIAPR